MLLNASNIGNQVLFGRTQGEKTHGTIVGFTRGNKAKVRQDEARGTHTVGTVWTVPTNLIFPADGAVPTVAPATSPTPTTGLSRFSVGQRVEFTKTGKVIQGTVERLNVKTASLMDCSDGLRWRVSPGLLRPATSPNAAPRKRAGAIIIAEIRVIDAKLSPENLYWDGERSVKAARAEERTLNAQRAALVRELGREPTSKELYGQ